MRINIARPLTRLHTQLRKLTYARYAGSRLRTGTLAAHEKHRLMLLGSPPDMVHGFPLRETGSSTLLTGVRLQGTAGSPTSAALSKAAEIL